MKSQTNRDYSIKIVAIVDLLPHCYKLRPWVQNAAELVFFFNFLNSFDEQLGHFELRNFLKELYEVV